jgi:hypothetical protein
MAANSLTKEDKQYSYSDVELNNFFSFYGCNRNAQTNLDSIFLNKFNALISSEKECLKKECLRFIKNNRIKIYVLIILLSDQYLSLKKNLSLNTQTVKIVRFFGLSLRLPMDMQMTVANRAAGSIEDYISNKNGTIDSAVKSTFKSFKN